MVDACRIVAEHGFVPPRPAGSSPRIGIEVEWLTVDLDRPDQAADDDIVRKVATAVCPLPGGGQVTFEPGGQLELSSPALVGLSACSTLAGDAALLGDALADAGVGLVSLGLEPGPQRERVVRSPRYDAMEAYFDAMGPAGRTMMRSTAALQINLDLGDGADIERRWRAAHDVGPVLAAAFANSPFADCMPSGWRSTRLSVWNAVDPSRTRPVADGSDCRRAWARYALAAPVMMARRSEHDLVTVLPPLTFAAWIEAGHDLGWPTVEDLEYHLTTLFPPVRPRGWLELRMIDAVPAPWWQAAVALTAAVLDDPDAATRATRAMPGLDEPWTAAARHGLDHPRLGAAARECFGPALDTLRGSGIDPDVVAATEAFVELYVERGRCPADERLDQWTRDGSVLPPPDNTRARWS
jgi:glutamate--cysteine ligase